MKYLEERIQDLEKEVQDLKIKLFQKEFEETKKHDYMYNHSNMTLLSEPKTETDFPPYPNIWGSWEPNDGDKIDEKIVSNSDEYGFKLNHESIFDKMDKDFLDWMKKDSISINQKV